MYIYKPPLSRERERDDWIHGCASEEEVPYGGYDLHDVGSERTREGVKKGAEGHNDLLH